MVTRLKPPQLAGDLKMLFTEGALGCLTDKELLARFLAKDDPSAV